MCALKEMVFAKMLGSGNDGGATSETGTFTLATNNTGGNPITINHSLNTTDIFGVIWCEPDENNEVNTHGGYGLIFAPFSTRTFPDEVFTGSTLVANYTSNEYKTASYTDVTNPMRTMKSSWTNKSASWLTHALLTLLTQNATAASFQIVCTSGSGPYFYAGATYRWKIWKIEGALA
jgi:hypothetical protein